METIFGFIVSMDLLHIIMVNNSPSKLQVIMKWAKRCATFETSEDNLVNRKRAKTRKVNQALNTVDKYSIHSNTHEVFQYHWEQIRDTCEMREHLETQLSHYYLWKHKWSNNDIWGKIYLQVFRYGSMYMYTWGGFFFKWSNIYFSHISIQRAKLLFH